MLWCAPYFCFLYISFLKFSDGTIDINPRQLQMVADSLTIDECKRLSESLHTEDYHLDHTPTGIDEPSGVSCIRLLQHWDKHEGKEKTFIPLATRLSQLGRDDIANKLSKSVFDESVMELREAVHLPMVTEDYTDEGISFQPVGFNVKPILQKKHAVPQKFTKLTFAIVSVSVISAIAVGMLLLRVACPNLKVKSSYHKVKSSCMC